MNISAKANLNINFEFAISLRGALGWLYVILRNVFG
jgi:hypothetical protein